MKTKRVAVATIAAIGMTVASVGAASAAVEFSLTGGTAGDIPDGATNDFLGAGNTLDGFFGATVNVIGGSAPIKAEFLGFEAGFQNTFTFDSFGTFDTESQASNNIFGSLGSFVTDPLTGELNFEFDTSGVAGDPNVTNANNPDNTGGMVNFFASIVGDPTSTTGSMVYLFLDDTGAGDDDNHDDMVIKLSVVPLPASILMLLGAFGSLGLFARGRRKVA